VAGWIAKYVEVALQAIEIGRNYACRPPFNERTSLSGVFLTAFLAFSYEISAPELALASNPASPAQIRLQILSANRLR
jgi:hypothetical protein